LENSRSVPSSTFSPLSLLYSVSLCPTLRRRFTGHVPSTGRPRRSKPCHVPPWHLRRRFPGSRWLLLLSPRRAAVARAATTPIGRQLLLPRDHAFFWTPSTSWSYPCIPSCLHATTFPRPFPLPSTTPRRTSATASGRRRQPPTPPPSLDLVLLEHRRDPLVLPSPSNFILPHPNIISRTAGELKTPPPLGLAVDPPIQSPFTPAKDMSSTTSTRRSFLAASSLPFDTLASKTPGRHRRR
jgi:hypothetical protein